MGHLPIAPGTWGSAAAVVVWWLLIARFPFEGRLLAVALTALLAIWAAQRAERGLGRDASPIVIDEVAGQWVTLSACPPSIVCVISGFLLFRLFDIWKPYPVRQSQRLPGGWGVVVDDLLAGGYAMLVIVGARLVLPHL